MQLWFMLSINFHSHSGGQVLCECPKVNAMRSATGSSGEGCSARTRQRKCRSPRPQRELPNQFLRTINGLELIFLKPPPQHLVQQNSRETKWTCLPFSPVGCFPIFGFTRGKWTPRRASTNLYRRRGSHHPSLRDTNRRLVISQLACTTDPFERLCWVPTSASGCATQHPGPVDAADFEMGTAKRSSATMGLPNGRSTNCPESYLRSHEKEPILPERELQPSTTCVSFWKLCVMFLTMF